MYWLLKLIRLMIWAFFILICIGGLTVTGTLMYLNPKLPSVTAIRDVRLQTPLRIYSSDNKLIGEFGEKRRIPISLENVPPLFIKAVIVAEDDSFENHHGFDVKSLMRAALELVRFGEIRSGGSTITMQVVRNYFLTPERSFTRKLKEILLAIRLESFLTKDEILELYFNKIYLGNRAYGIQAAADVYYGKTIDQLTLGQWAMLAGLPKAPSKYNPIANPKRAMQRRNWILSRMYEFEFTDQTSYELAIKEPITASFHGPKIEVDAPYVAEMVRAELVKRFDDETYSAGFKVYTTINSKLQEKAQTALQKNLLAYTRRHGYRGPEDHFPPDQHFTKADWQALLAKTSIVGGLVPGVVTAVNEKTIRVLLKNDQEINVNWDGLKWARPYIKANRVGPSPKTAADIVSVGDLIRIEWKINPKSETVIESGADPLELVQVEPEQIAMLANIPKAQSAFVSLNPWDGGIIAITGGFDFNRSEFNRATQARRQPGSCFKPFVYLSALESGYSAASIVNDSPLAMEDPSLNDLWRPKNSGGDFLGPITLREALYRSRNLVSIRLVRSLGVDNVINFAEKFGFSKSTLPKGLSLALGTASLTPLEVATGYAALANGGYKVNPYLITRLEDATGNVVFQANPLRACSMENCAHDIFNNTPYSPVVSHDVEISAFETNKQAFSNDFKTQLNQLLTKKQTATRIVDERYVYILQTMLKDVITRGTATPARALERNDIAGKTGTTNDQLDAWFTGFNANLVAAAWVGFDQPSTLGRSEFGGKAALPLWMDFMQEALTGLPEASMEMPEDLVIVKIDPQSGQLNHNNGVPEWFTNETIPSEKSIDHQNNGDNPVNIEQIF